MRDLAVKSSHTIDGDAALIWLCILQVLRIMLMSVMRKAGSDIKVVETFSENQRSASAHTKNRNADGLPFIRLIAVKDATRTNREGKVMVYNAIVPVMENPLFDSAQPESDTNRKVVERYDLALSQWDLDTDTYTDYEVEEIGKVRKVTGALHLKYQELDGAGVSPDIIWPTLAAMFPDGGICHGYRYRGKSQKWGGKFPACILDFVATTDEHQKLVEEYNDLIARERKELAAKQNA